MSDFDTAQERISALDAKLAATEKARQNCMERVMELVQANVDVANINVDLIERTHELEAALNGMIGLVQLLSNNADIPVEIHAMMTANHRFKAAQLCFPDTKWDEYGLKAPETPAAADPNNGLPEPSSFPPMPPVERNMSDFAQGGPQAAGRKPPVEPDGVEHFIPAAAVPNAVVGNMSGTARINIAKVFSRLSAGAAETSVGGPKKTDADPAKNENEGITK